jgi:hypothetical protein
VVQKKSTYLNLLAKVIRDLHGYPALHVQTVFVSLLDVENNTLQRDVEVFALLLHSEARKCFAWSDPAGEPVILLGTAEVNSPEQALRTFYAKRNA